MSYKHYDKIMEFVKYAINAHGSVNEEADEMTLSGNDIDAVAKDVADLICGEVDQ